MNDERLVSSDGDTDAKLHAAAEQLVRARQRTILLVEDTAAHALIIRRTLSSAGWDVEHVTRASAALDSFQRDSERIVLLDLSLPDSEGMQLLARLRAFNPQAAIVVVTATDRVAVSVDAMKRGACDYVVKEDPAVTAEQLLTAVDRAWLGRVRAAENKLIETTRLVETLRAERLEAIEVVVRTVCHEVSNPLTGVVALSQMLSKNTGLDADLQRIAEGIVKSAQQVREVVDKLKAVGDTVVEFGGKQILDISAPEKLPRRPES